MGEIAHSRLSVFQDRNIHDAKNEKDSRKTLTSPYAVSNAMVIDKCEETKGDNNGTKNANELYQGSRSQPIARSPIDRSQSQPITPSTIATYRHRNRLRDQVHLRS